MNPPYIIQRCMPKRSNPLSVRAEAVFSFLCSVNRNRTMSDHAMIRLHVSRRIYG